MRFKFCVLLALLFFNTFVFGQCYSLEAEKLANQSFNNSEYALAVKYYEECILTSANCPDSTKSSLYIDLSKSLIYLARYDESYVTLSKAEDYALKSKSPNHIVKAYLSFAEYFRAAQKYEKAEKYLEKCEVIIAQNKVKEILLAYYYSRKAAIFSEYKSDQEAVIEYSKKSFAIAKSHKNSQLQATALNEIGHAYENFKVPDFDKALLAYNQAYEIWKGMKQDLFIVGVLQNIVRVYIKKEDYNNALIFNTKACEIATKKKFDYNEIVLLDQQYVIYKKLGNIKLALEYLEKSKQLNNNYIAKINKEKLLELEAKYESTKKDKELQIKTLSIQNQKLQIKRSQNNLIYLAVAVFLILVILLLIARYSYKTKNSNKQLKQLLNENEFLLSESNHRIKNNLQLITALIYQELDKQNIEFEKSDWFEVIEKIESVSSLHKQLYVHESKDLIRVQMYLNDIKSNFDSYFTKKGIKVDFDVADIQIPINKATYLGLLCTELILNSLKHAFKEEQEVKTIFLHLKEENLKLSLEYKDSGPGLKSENMKLKLIHMMSKQLKFDYSIVSDENFHFIAIFTKTL